MHVYTFGRLMIVVDGFGRVAQVAVLVENGTFLYVEDETYGDEFASQNRRNQTLIDQEARFRAFRKSQLERNKQLRKHEMEDA